jgi:hypothetical protein
MQTRREHDDVVFSERMGTKWRPSAPDATRSTKRGRGFMVLTSALSLAELAQKSLAAAKPDLTPWTVAPTRSS